MANALEHLAIQTKLEWTASLNTEFQPEKNYRRTSIIGTIGMSMSPEASQAADFPTKLCVTGPKTNSAEKISMLRSGIVNRVSSALAQLLTSMFNNSWSERCPHELFSWLLRGEGQLRGQRNQQLTFFEYHQSVIDNAHESTKQQPGRPLAIALDTVCG